MLDIGDTKKTSQEARISEERRFMKEDPNLPRKEQRKQNIHRYVKKKEEKKPKRKQVIVHVDDLLVQKLITLITLGEYFPPKFLNRGMATSTHMVSCHEISEEDESSKDEENAFGVEPSKTKEDDEVVANLQCLPSLFSIHEMLQLLDET